MCRGLFKTQTVLHAEQQIKKQSQAAWWTRVQWRRRNQIIKNQSENSNKRLWHDNQLQFSHEAVNLTHELLPGSAPFFFFLLSFHLNTLYSKQNQSIQIFFHVTVVIKFQLMMQREVCVQKYAAPLCTSEPRWFKKLRSAWRSRERLIGCRDTDANVIAAGLVSNKSLTLTPALIWWSKLPAAVFVCSLETSPPLLFSFLCFYQSFWCRGYKAVSVTTVWSHSFFFY